MPSTIHKLRRYECQTRLYSIWHGMKQRCGNPKNKRYHRYGGRGISVCPEWHNSFKSFKAWALANGYADHLTIDRYPDQDGGYHPGNCRWATPKQQSENIKVSLRGRPTKLNWTPCYNQYTCTIDGKRHRLGKDKEKAEKQFKFLMRQSERGAEPDPSITFHEVCDYFLEHVKEHHNPDRYRICSERLQEFKDHLGEGFRVKDLRPAHVNAWLKAKGKLTKGTERLYKSILLSCLNWSARPKDRKGGELIVENPLKGQLHLPEGESRGKEAVWTKEVYEQVLSVASPAFCDLVNFLMWTGTRMTTAIRLEARHYNKAQSRFDCADLERGKKKAKYVRLLSDECRELVEKLVKEHPEGPLFRNSKGNPWDQDAPQIYLFNLQTKFLHSKDLKWPENLTMKGIRHTFSCNFLQQHPNEIEFLRILLNHVDYKMILRTYGHMIDMDHVAFKRLDGFRPFGASES